MTTTLEKIAALLRQAESTTNEAEREAFMTGAQRLASLSAIDLEVARRHVPAHERRELPEQRIIRMGESRTNGLAAYVNLFHGVAQANDVKINIAQNSTYVVAFGFPSDIEVCEALFTSLLVQMVEATNAYIKSGAFKTETTYRSRNGVWGHHPIHGKTARVAFQDGFAVRIFGRLSEARISAIQERTEIEAADPDYVATEDSVALVLADKKATVNDFYKETSKARGSWRGGSSGGGSYTSREAGSKAANNARLSAPRALAGSKGALR
jgi:hypothetical protein